MYNPGMISETDGIGGGTVKKEGKSILIGSAICVASDRQVM